MSAERKSRGLDAVTVELAPGLRIIALEENTDRSRSTDRWEIGERIKLGWHPEHARVLR